MAKVYLTPSPSPRAERGELAQSGFPHSVHPRRSKQNPKAQELDAILISLNGDFSDIVTYPPAQYKGIVALQIRNHSEVTPQIMARMKAYLSVHPDMAEFEGKLLLAEVHRIRVRQ